MWTPRTGRGITGSFGPRAHALSSWCLHRTPFRLSARVCDRAVRVHERVGGLDVQALELRLAEFERAGLAPVVPDSDLPAVLAGVQRGLNGGNFDLTHCDSSLVWLVSASVTNRRRRSEVDRFAYHQALSNTSRGAYG